MERRRVPLERIRALTLELQQHPDDDAVAVLTMRLLLNDYMSAVSYLREVARGAQARLADAAVRIAESRKQVRREGELAAKRAARLDDRTEAV